MKFLLLFFLLGTVLSVQSQGKVADIKGDFGNIKQSFNVEDSATGNFGIFLEDNEKVYGILYNPQFEEIGRVSAPDLSSKFKSVVGYQINGKHISLLMNTRNGRSYGVVQFNFETGKGTSQELEFKVQNEKVIDAVNYKNTVYLISVPTFSSQLNIYSFNNMLSPVLTEVKFDENTFLDKNERSKRLFDIIEGAEIRTVNIETPNSLELTSTDFKLYQQGKKVVLTSDKYNEFTYVVNLDLETFATNVKRISKPDFEGSLMGLRTNSFWYKDKLFQASANMDYLKFQLVDLSTEEVIKKYEVADEDELFFKNSPIIFVGSDYNGLRPLKRTKQFLRKIHEGEIGISVLKNNDIYQVTLGGTVESENGYIMLGGALGGIAGALIVASINSVAMNYAGYTNTKSVQIIGLFDENLNHLVGDIPKNPFDVIFKEPVESEVPTERFTIQAETLFKLGDNYIRGFYIKKLEVYSLYKF